MSVTDELDALIEELDHAVGDETGAYPPDAASVAGEPDTSTYSPDADALDLILSPLHPREAANRLPPQALEEMLELLATKTATNRQRRKRR